MITLFPNTWCFNVFHTSFRQSILFAEISHQAMRSAFIGSLQVRCRLARIAHAMSAHSMLQILRYDDDVFFFGSLLRPWFLGVVFVVGFRMVPFEVSDCLSVSPGATCVIACAGNYAGKLTTQTAHSHEPRSAKFRQSARD